MKRTILLAGACAVIATGGLGLAYAAMAPENDALADAPALASAKIGLQQAVAIAEGHVGGKAAHAAFGQGPGKRGKAVFEIEVVQGTTVTDVKVDAASGNVLSAVPDDADLADTAGERDDD